MLVRLMRAPMAAPQILRSHLFEPFLLVIVSVRKINLMDSNKTKSIAKLSVFTIAIMNVTAVVSLRGLPAEAEYGLSSAFYYLFAALVFLIHVIAGQQAPAVVEEVLKSGADPDWKTPGGRSLAELAKDPKIVKLLKKYSRK